MEKKKLHMIGNAHLDLVWLWRWQEGMQEAKSTFRSALDRMKESDEFLFTSSSAALYEFVERNAPEMFEEIRARIAEGRWELAGGWWIQPDCNIPSGESFVRQGLYGQRYFYEKFGVTARTAYNVDSFGHSGILPQIFKKSGMDYYVMMRPMSHEKGLPAHLFQWESDDGSRVLAFRILYEYLSWGKELDHHIRRCGAEISESAPQIMCFYGVGNHGGGPTVENIESIRQAAAKGGDTEILFSSPNRYFDGVRARAEELPVVHGELLHHAAGCYSAHSGIKKWNRQGENRLLAAEKWSAVAQLRTGLPYPRDFDWAWKKLLVNQFHDTLAGTSIGAAYDDAAQWAGAALCVAEENLNHAVQSLGWAVHIPQEEGVQPLVVFNPVGRNVKTFLDWETYGGEEDSFTLWDSRGREIPCQKLKSRVQVDGRCRVGFVAELPALGYATLRLQKKEVPQAKSRVSTTDSTLENQRFLLELDPETGYIRRYRDKQAGVEILKGDGAVPLVIEDLSDTWSHDVVRFDKVVGSFRARSVRLVEQGPVCATIRVISEYGASRLVQDFTMYADLDRVDVRAKIIWNESRKAFKLAFPVGTFFNKYCYETAFGFTERGNTGEEYPMQGWMDATGVPANEAEIYGFSILNTGKYSGSVDHNTLHLTLLRSPVYAHHNPNVLQEGEEYDIVDQGVQLVEYALYPHQGKWESSDLEVQAQSLNQPPVVLPETFHEGPLPQWDSFLEIGIPGVQLSALKEAEDGGGVVLRLYEAHKSKATGVVRLPAWERELALEFGPNEVKTLLIPHSPKDPVKTVNLIEFEEE